MVVVHCNYCKMVFDRPRGRYNEAIKMGWRQFCSHECQRLAKTMTKISCACKTCGEKVQRLESRIEPSGNIFCSHRCAAKYTNSQRVTDLMIRKAKRALTKPVCSNPQCVEQIGLNNKLFCSTECRLSFAKYQSKKYVVSKIQMFVRSHGRIPLKQEMGGVYARSRVGFGTWNKAIMAAGFEPNPVMFAKHYQANDGHRCDSLAEKIVDDWLFARKIKHQINVPYPFDNGMTGDFLVEDVWIEIFGLAGEHKRYDELKAEKLKLVRGHNLTLIEISLKDVYGGRFQDRLGKISC